MPLGVTPMGGSAHGPGRPIQPADLSNVTANVAPEWRQVGVVAPGRGTVSETFPDRQSAGIVGDVVEMVIDGVVVPPGASPCGPFADLGGEVWMSDELPVQAATAAPVTSVPTRTTALLQR
jgi:hypothetical protein